METKANNFEKLVCEINQRYLEELGEAANKKQMECMEAVIKKAWMKQLERMEDGMRQCGEDALRNQMKEDEYAAIRYTSEYAEAGDWNKATSISAFMSDHQAALFCRDGTAHCIVEDGLHTRAFHNFIEGLTQRKLSKWRPDMPLDCKECEEIYKGMPTLAESPPSWGKPRATKKRKNTDDDAK